MKAIVGLGNPGREYSGTRHNVGFQVIDILAKRMHLTVKNHYRQSLYTQGELEGKSVILVKPVTYMNNSGAAVKQVLEKWKLKPEDILIISDDVNLPLGKLRLREGGSAGGHNGLKSIIALLGTDDFPRLRIGVGSPGSDMIEHVLGHFNNAERLEIHQAEERAVETIEAILRDGIEQAMNQFNG